MNKKFETPQILQEANASFCFRLATGLHTSKWQNHCQNPRTSRDVNFLIFFSEINWIETLRYFRWSLTEYHLIINSFELRHALSLSNILTLYRFFHSAAKWTMEFPCQHYDDGQLYLYKLCLSLIIEIITGS